jgi:adenylate cyclase
MKKKTRHRLLQAAGTACISATLALALLQAGALTTWENKVWDLQNQLLARPSSHTDKITLVLVDQESLEWVQKNMALSWPWPRELYGALVDNITRHQATGIGFDVLFTEPSIFGVSDDAAFGESISAAEHFAAGSVFPGRTHGKHKKWPDNIPRPSFKGAADLLLQSSKFPSYDRATMPIPEVARHAAILCNVHQDPDEDGIYRALHPLVFFDDVPLPALGLGMYLTTHPDTSLSFQDDTLNIGGYSVPIDEQGRALIHFRGPPETYTQLSAAALLREEMLYREDTEKTFMLNEQLHDKYVLFGFSAPGLFDLRPTPVGGIFSGVEINATLLDNLLSRDFITPLGRGLQASFSCTTALLIGLLFAYVSGPLLLGITSLFFLLLPPVLSFTLYYYGYRFELLPFEIASGGTIALGFVINYMHEGRQRRFIKHSFKHYLSPHVIEELIQNPDKLQLGGDRKELTIFFSDLQGFTSISENLDPDQLIQLLNDYLSAMTDIILEEDGTVDKYEGDAIIAFWNAPLETSDHAVRAVSAALRCQKRLAELRPLFKEQCGHEMYMRIGINSGPAVVGNLGSTNRFDYSMLGDAVNLAARLEGANKQFDSYTMISESTHALIDNAFLCRELALLTVVGRKEAVRVYEPFLDSDWKQQKKSLMIFTTGLKAFYAGDFQAAIVAFEKITEQDPSARKYLAKCKSLQRNQPAGWDGVWSLTSK